MRFLRAGAGRRARSAAGKPGGANVAMTGSSQDAISISEFPSAVESSSETEAFQKKPGTAKPYFDPAEGCYIRLAEEGKVSRGVLEKGPAGFCLVRFEDEEPFPSKCPTCGLLRRLQSQGPSSRGFEPLARARAKARASRPRALLLHQLLKKLQQILKAIPGRKLALWRAAEPIPAETSSASKKILFGVT